MSVSRESNWIITLTSGFFQIKIENISLFRLIKKHGNVFENWLYQIFSCCPKYLSCPKFGGAGAPLAPPARTPMELRKREHENKTGKNGESPKLSENLEQAKLGQVRKRVWILEIWSENGCGK